METLGSPVYDATGKVDSDDNFDPEAQAISQDFKRPPY